MSDLALAAKRVVPSLGARWLAIFLCLAGAVHFLMDAAQPVALGNAVASATGQRLVNAICRQIPHCRRARIDRHYVPAGGERPPGWHLRVTIAGARMDPAMIRATVSRLLLRSHVTALQQQAHAFLLRLLPATAAAQIEVQP